MKMNYMHFLLVKGIKRYNKAIHKAYSDHLPGRLQPSFKIRDLLKPHSSVMPATVERRYNEVQGTGKMCSL